MIYSSIIEIKKSIHSEALQKLRETSEKGFDNQAWKVENSSADLHRLAFEGQEDNYGCLDLGAAELADTSGFREQINAWKRVDADEPGENGDILEIYAEPVY